MATEPTILDRVKSALRITHAALDDNISLVISGARAEMTRCGIDSDKASDDTDSLIVLAIISYALYWFSNDEKQKAELFQSWSYQLDCLRKTYAYTEAADV